MSNEAGTDFFYIPETNMGKFEHSIKNLSKRSVRYGGEPIDFYVFGHEYRDHVTTTGATVKVKFIEVFLEGEAPSFNGWKFVARLDHAPETGNIIRAVPNVGIEIPEKYRTIGPHCDHCNVNRLRRDTFLLCEESKNEFMQVGSSCLNGFFGLDASKIAKRAELLAYAREAALSLREFSEEGLINKSYVNLEGYLAFVANLIAKNGWVSRADAKLTDASRSTAWQARHYYFDNHPTVDFRVEEDFDVAHNAIDWALSLNEKDTLNDYEHNVLAVAGSQYIEVRSMGLAASIVAGYLRSKAPTLAGGEHFGKVGEKVEFTGKIVSVYKGDNQSGTFYAYKFRSVNGDIASCFLQKSLNLPNGTAVKVSGKVKKHGEFKGVKETAMNYCKVEVSA